MWNIANLLILYLIFDIWYDSNRHSSRNHSFISSYYCYWYHQVKTLKVSRRFSRYLYHKITVTALVLTHSDTREQVLAFTALSLLMDKRQALVQSASSVTVNKKPNESHHMEEVPQESFLTHPLQLCGSWNPDFELLSKLKFFLLSLSRSSSGGKSRLCWRNWSNRKRPTCVQEAEEPKCQQWLSSDFKFTVFVVPHSFFVCPRIGFPLLSCDEGVVIKRGKHSFGMWFV